MSTANTRGRPRNLATIAANALKGSVITRAEFIQIRYNPKNDESVCDIVTVSPTDAGKRHYSSRRDYIPASNKRVEPKNRFRDDSMSRQVYYDGTWIECKGIDGIGVMSEKAYLKLATNW